MARHYRTGETLHLRSGQRTIGPTYADADAKAKEHGKEGKRKEEIAQTVTADHWIAPALIDIQINGFGGVSFNGPQVSPEDVCTIVRQQWSLGIGSLCPTVTTNSQANILHALSCISEACRDAEIADSILGVHVEGPYISPEDGPRGAHSLRYVRTPDWDEFCQWQDAAEGRICLVTLAPEVEGAIGFIERLADEGIVVAIGHTNAEADDIDRAIDAGARLSTHLGNGAHALIRRHPNYIWEQLARDELTASLIVDGHHLPPSVVKCMTRCKGLGRVVLVSDAVTFAGMPPGRYGKGDSLVDVSEEGRISLADTPYLAGAGLDLATCVANFIRFTGHSLADAIDAATLHPARLLGRNEELGSLEVGQRADWIVFRWDGQTFEVVETVKAGRSVFQA